MQPRSAKNLCSYLLRIFIPLIVILGFLLPPLETNAARTSVATDNFNRSTGLGSNWTQLNPNWGNIQIEADNDDVRGGSSGGEHQAARWNGAGTFTDDQYASLVVTTLAFQSDNYSIGVICRGSADIDANRDYYEAVVYPDSSNENRTTALNKYVNGTKTQLHSGIVAWSSGDKIELECEGSTIRVMKNGTALGGSFTQTDTSLTAGKPGIAAASDADNQASGDDWEGGNLTSDAGVVPGRTIRLFEGYSVKLIEGRIILHQKQ